MFLVALLRVITVNFVELAQGFMSKASVPDKKLEIDGRTRFDGSYEAPSPLVP
jgi:hypothetical protein